MSDRVTKEYRWGTDRVVDPGGTLARVAPHLTAMGITRVANVTGLDRIGIPVVTVCRPNSRSLAVHLGKGPTLAAAKASGVMEAIEVHHAERIAVPRVVAAHDDLRRRARVADVRGLPRVKGGAFRPGRPIPWVEGSDLITGEPVWVPYELVHTDYTFPLLLGGGCFAASTNGLASGNHALEAISHAICEVVERDAATLWFQRSARAQARARIDLGSVEDPWCREALERFARADVLVAAWEMTTDVGIPAFLGQIVERSPSPLRPLYGAHGMGCHPRREVALLRALTEAAQCRLAWIAGTRDDFRRERYDEYTGEDALREEYESVTAPEPERPFVNGPTWETPTLDEDVAWELERLQAAGLGTVVCVDLTRPEFGIPVVRVIVPGLEGPGFGDALAWYVPGRRARALARSRAPRPTPRRTGQPAGSRA